MSAKLGSIYNQVMTQRSNEAQLEPDEIRACEALACDDPEVGTLLEQWAHVSVRGRSAALDEAFCDRLEILLSKNLFRIQQERDEVEPLEIDDEHEGLGFGA